MRLSQNSRRLLPEKELKSVPINLRHSYLYHILDIYFENEDAEFTSMVDVANYTERQPPTTKRQHVVRGHFKRKNGKLYWWNTFVRSRRSETGIVEKDYRVNF